MAKLKAYEHDQLQATVFPLEFGPSKTTVLFKLRALQRLGFGALALRLALASMTSFIVFDSTDAEIWGSSTYLSVRRDGLIHVEV